MSDDKKAKEETTKKVKNKIHNTKKKERVYNVKVKPNVWGRRREDSKIKKVKQISNPNPKYPGKAPVPKELLEKYSRGDGINKSGIKTGIYKKKLEHKERNIEFTTEQAARVEILLTEDTGLVVLFLIIIIILLK